MDGPGFAPAALERLKKNLPRFRPGTASSPPHAADGFDATYEQRLMDRLLGPASATPGRVAGAPRVGAAGAPGLLPSLTRPATAGAPPPPSQQLPRLAQPAASPPAARAPQASGSPPAAAAALSGAGGGLVGALASRLSALEAEAAALRGELAAREREAAGRAKEVAALRRQLEGALGEARSAREAAGARERVLSVSGAGAQAPGAAAAAAAAAAAVAPRAPAAAASPQPASAATASASPVTAGELQLHREASARAEAATLRQELSSVLRDREALEGQVSALQRQNRDMARFLNDYGLEWVGHEGSAAASAALGAGAGSSSSSSSSSSAKGGSTAEEAQQPPALDFALLLFRLQQLNALAGEGKSRIVSKDGAHQLVTEPLGGRLSLTLYRDGLLLRRGPFRPYARDATRSFVQDIMEGYFPFELKESYPDGVVFDVVNKTQESYMASASDGSGGGGGSTDGTASGFVAFRGVGRSLGGGSKQASAAAAADSRVSHIPSAAGGSESAAGGGDTGTFYLPPALAHSSAASSTSARPATLSSPAPPQQQALSAAQLLSALPARAVTGKGVLVDVRGSVARALGGAGAGAGAGDIGSSSSGQQQQPLQSEAPPSSGSAMLKVRLDGGSGSGSAGSTIVLQLRAEDTVAYLLACVAGQRVAATPFELRSAAPPRSFSAGGPSVSLTLAEAGLTPTAALFVRAL